MLGEALLYIEDEEQRKLYYHFTPATFISNFVPLVIVLDKEERIKMQGSEYKMWNILTPLNSIREKEDASYWLSEKGESHRRDLLQKLIHDIADEYECEAHIYLYGGSDEDGYDAILHGILCNANAIYAYGPSIRRKETKSVEQKSDLTKFLNPSDQFPVFYLCDDEIIKGNPPQEETAYFAQYCKKNDITVDLDFCARGDDETERFKRVLDFFERVASER